MGEKYLDMTAMGAAAPGTVAAWSGGRRLGGRVSWWSNALELAESTKTKLSTVVACLL